MSDDKKREQGAGEFHSETPWIWALAGEITSKMEDMGAGMVFAKGHPDAEAAAMIAAAMNTLPPDSERRTLWELTDRNIDLKAKNAELEREVKNLKYLLHEIETTDVTIAVQSREEFRQQRDALVLRNTALEREVKRLKNCHPVKAIAGWKAKNAELEAKVARAAEYIEHRETRNKNLTACLKASRGEAGKGAIRIAELEAELERLQSDYDSQGDPMSDQCKYCNVRGNIEDCRGSECFHHENWYALEQAAEITRLRSAITTLLEDLEGRRLEAGTVCAVAIVRGVLEGMPIETTPRACSTCRWEADSGECLSKMGVCAGKDLRFWEPKEATKEVAKETAQEAAEERTRFLNETTEDTQ